MIDTAVYFIKKHKVYKTTLRYKFSTGIYILKDSGKTKKKPTLHCKKNNLNPCIKSKPFMAGADKTVIKGFCEQILSLRNQT